MAEERVSPWTDEDATLNDPDDPLLESPLTYEAGPGFFLPVGTGPRKARRLADEAGVKLWWSKREEFIESGKDYEKYFGRGFSEINPDLLDEDGIPIPSIYTGTTVWGKSISATPLPNYVKNVPGKVSDKWKPTVSKPLPAIQCQTVKADGHQCGRWAIRGGSVCIKHGGRLPAVKANADATVEAARLRLVDMTDGAVDVLQELITTRGTPDAIRLKAATEVLDRAGVKGGMEINVEVEHKVSAADAVQGRFAEIQARKAAEIEKRRLLEERRLADEADIIDAEVIEDEPSVVDAPEKAL